MIECRSLAARAGRFELRDVSFALPEGGWGIVLGPAGAGKTTLLETIAGVRRAARGTVLLRGVPVTTMAAELRRVGIVYQHGFLFPHLTVAENVGYGASDAEYARALGRRFGIEGLWDRSVTALSGGERQVVALARALAPRPDVLLLDEPFASLDPRGRTRVRRELRALVREQGLTVLQVTHDLAEAGIVGDLALLMEGGRLVQAGTPEELFRRPASAAAADFLGAENLLAGVAECAPGERPGGGRADSREDTARLVRFRTGAGLTLLAVGEVADGACHAVVRGEDVTLARERPNVSSVRNVVEGRVAEVAREGPLARVTVEVGSDALVACVTTSAVDELALAEGVRVFASVKASAVHLC